MSAAPRPARPTDRRPRRLRARGPGLLAVAAIALVTPGLLVVNGVRVVARDWIVAHEYGSDGFPADRYGLDRDQRTALALTGLDSIRPGTEGIELLRRATLPDGSPAFDERELRHMDDVRRVLGGALRLQLVALVALALLALALARTAGRRIVPAGLAWGAALTLGVAAALVPVILLGFDGFFVRFHEVFFDGDSWRFSDTDTLLRLYPERFWVDVSRLIAALTVAQALILAPLAWLWRRRVRPEAS